MAKNITETGVKGFLLWLKQEQPGIYQKVATQLPTITPKAFSDYHAGGWRTAGMSAKHKRAASAALAGLGDDPTMETLSDSDLQAMLSTPVTVDLSTAANSGTTDSSLANTIGSVVQGISALYLTKQQADIQQQVVNTQLQRAAAGLPPLPTSLSSLGVPQVQVGLSSGTGTGLIIGGALLLGLLLFSGGGSGGRRRAA